MVGEPRRAALRVLLVAASVLAAFVAFNVLAAALVRGARIDLTSTRAYTMSPGVKPLLRGLKEPVKLELFYSAEAARGIPTVVAYAQRVREFLEELVGASGGTLSLRVIDPLPYSEAEDAAVAAGLAALSVDGSGRTLTLGLVATNSVDESRALPFLDPLKEGFLEYDVLRLIESVGRTSKARIGLLSTLPLRGGLPPGFDPTSAAGLRPTPPWQIDSQLRELFEVVDLDADDAALPERLDALLLVQPSGLGEPLLRAIDAFAQRGGRIVAFLDPYCEHAAAPTDPTAGIALEEARSFDLGGLPKAWGVQIPRGQVVGDAAFAQRVQAPGRRGAAPQVVDYIAWLAVGREGLDAESPITGALERVNMATVGAIGAAEGSTTMQPLIRSSDESALIESAQLGFMPDPARLLAAFRPDGGRRTLAATVEGAVGSAFPDGAVPDGAAPATIVVVADADLLADENWIVEERIGQMSLGARTVADNGNLVLNAVELLSGADALLALRGRGHPVRGFDRVEAIRRAAEAQYLARERELQDEIEATQQKIGDLQRARPAEGGAARQLILSPEQEKELEALEREVLAARSELRQVQFDLRADVERLGTRLMVVNVVAWPLMVALAALIWSVNRMGRTRRGPA